MGRRTLNRMASGVCVFPRCRPSLFRRTLLQQTPADFHAALFLSEDDNNNLVRMLGDWEAYTDFDYDYNDYDDCNDYDDHMNEAKFERTRHVSLGRSKEIMHKRRFATKQ